MQWISAKTILQSVKQQSQWFGFDYNINIYKGCNHGCIYCFSRNECYRIAEFDQVRAKKDAIDILNSELKRKKKKGIINIGAMSDPYNAMEKKYELTRQTVELLLNHQYGLSLSTKSDLILRDLDLYCELNKREQVLLKMSIIDTNDELAKKIEPGATTPTKRFDALSKLCDRGINVGVLAHPILPFITDSEENIRELVRNTKECGASFIHTFFGVTLRSNQRNYFYEQLHRHFPRLPSVYMHQYGNEYACLSPDFAHLQKVYQEECDRLGLLYHMSDIIQANREAQAKKEGSTQTSFF